MATYKTEGIILKKNNFGEADQIITIFSKHYGKIKAIAKGVRRITSRKAGSVELLNRCTLFLAEGKNLDIVTEVEAIDTYPSIKKNLELTAQVYYLCELIDKLTAEKQENKNVFELLIEVLKELESNALTADEVTLLIASFEIKLLNVLGFWSLKQVKNVYILADEDCLRLEKLEHTPFSEIRRFSADRDVVGKLKEITQDCLQYVMEREAKSLNFIRDVDKLQER